MDNYQKFMFRNIGLKMEYPNGKTFDATISDQNTITIKQDDNIALKNYILHIRGFFIKNIWTISNNNKNELFFTSKEYAPKKIFEREYLIQLDFESKIDAIEFEFEKNYADNYILNFIYAEANKEAYYSKVENTKRQLLLSEINVNYRTGANLVNIFFQPCCSDYARTEIELYTAQGKWSSPPLARPRGVVFTPQLVSATVDTFIGNFRVEEGQYFKSITGLANGAYGFVLLQYSVNNQLLLKTDTVFFGIV